MKMCGKSFLIPMELAASTATADVAADAAADAADADAAAADTATLLVRHCSLIIMGVCRPTVQKFYKKKFSFQWNWLVVLHVASF